MEIKMRRVSLFALMLSTLVSASALGQTGAGSPSAAQPNLAPGAPVRPEPVPFAPTKPGSPVVQELVGGGGRPLVVRKRGGRDHVARGHASRHHDARRSVPLDLDRPALAGVTLLQPLPQTPQPPHIVVPLPAYPLENVAASFLTPAPPIVCRRTPRIRDLPDPRLYKEATLECEADNP